MNTATKQLNAVEKVLGDMAYEDVFIYETTNENWTRLWIADSNITRVGLLEMFVDKFACDIEEGNDRVIYVSKRKI